MKTAFGEFKIDSPELLSRLAPTSLQLAGRRKMRAPLSSVWKVTFAFILATSAAPLACGADGVPPWANRYSGPLLPFTCSDDRAAAVAVDSSGNCS